MNSKFTAITDNNKGGIEISYLINMEISEYFHNNITLINFQNLIIIFF